MEGRDGGRPSAPTGTQRLRLVQNVYSVYAAAVLIANADQWSTVKGPVCQIELHL